MLGKGKCGSKRLWGHVLSFVMLSWALFPAVLEPSGRPGRSRYIFISSPQTPRRVVDTREDKSLVRSYSTLDPFSHQIPSRTVVLTMWGVILEKNSPVFSKKQESVSRNPSRVSWPVISAIPNFVSSLPCVFVR